MYPDDCVQSIVGSTDWWVKNNEQNLCRGALIFAFAPHVDQIPYTFEPLGRTEATRHDKATIRATPLRVDQPIKKVDLPVAAMPLHSGEVWAAYRAKKRPCLAIGSSSPSVDREVTKGMAKHSTAPTVLAAPYYGATRNSKRGGFKPEFVERIRHCEYPQFLWDRLPISGPEESILRLDHLQPIGTAQNSYQLSDYKLSENALEVVDELFQWLLMGGVYPDSLIAMYREEIETVFGT
jgi:hypothetical protein